MPGPPGLAGTAELLWKWWGWQVTQSGGAKNSFFLVTLYNFQKRGRAIALAAPPPPRSLFILYQMPGICPGCEGRSIIIPETPMSPHIIAPLLSPCRMRLLHYYPGTSRSLHYYPRNANIAPLRSTGHQGRSIINPKTSINVAPLLTLGCEGRSSPGL